MKSIEILLTQYQVVKQQEDLLTMRRRELAAQIVEAFGHKEVDCSRTHKDAEGWKVTIKVPTNSRMDWSKWKEIESRFVTDDQDLRPIETKPAVSDRAVKWLQANRPDLYLLLAEALTVSPGAPQVKVERVTQEEVS